MPQPKRKQRRVNPHKAPWDKYPIIVWTPDPNYVEPELTVEDWDAIFNDPSFDLNAPTPARVVGDLGDIHGTLTVTRGQFDTTQLPERCLDAMKDRPGIEFIIQTDGTGHARVLGTGRLVDAELADTDPKDTGHFPTGSTHVPVLNRDIPGANLTDWAAALRLKAQDLLDVADQYDQLAADGWEIVPTQPEIGYYPPPLRRRPADDA
ncbi:hypothetical protein ACNKF0_09290 [Nocardioides sp. T5]|uniref:hypothetical protein n=1 Tax=Nocardioides sp. T5 TaxID=3400182 RepID=UPI003A84D334